MGRRRVVRDRVYVQMTGNQQSPRQTFAKIVPNMLPRLIGYVVYFSTLALIPLMAQPNSPLARARDLYKRTESAQALRVLEPIKNPDTAAIQLIGQTEYGMGD